jgi:hypothetical protein
MSYIPEKLDVKITHFPRSKPPLAGGVAPVLEWMTQHLTGPLAVTSGSRSVG